MTALVMLMLVSVHYGQGAFATNCPTIEEQQAAYNQSLANGIVVRDTHTQQLQCHYQQLATYWNQVHKTKQQDDKTVQQIAKDQQQIAKDKQQLERDAYLIAWETRLKTWEIELKAREAQIKECEEECRDMYNFCNELKIIIEGPDLNDKKLADHCKLKINHSGQADGTNPGGTTNNNGGILNPSN